jgi:hypothetical protein
MPATKKSRCTHDEPVTLDVSPDGSAAASAELPAVVSTPDQCAKGTYNLGKRKWKSFPSIVASNASLPAADGVVIQCDDGSTLVPDSSHSDICLPVKRCLDEPCEVPSYGSIPSTSPVPAYSSCAVTIDDSTAINDGIAVKDTLSSPPPKQHLPSPSQRDAFQASLYVTKVTSNLSTVNAAPGARVNFDGTVVVVYPCEANPARRYVLLADDHGTIGITFWNQNVSKFNSSTVGHVIQLTKVLITQHNGKKSITMNKESGLTVTEQIAPFWTQLARNPVISIVDVHSMPVNSFVSIAGVLGFLHSERKIVKNEEKELVIMKIIDRTGQIEVQSWVSKLADFSCYRDRPVKFQRLRVVAFGGVKCLEILDGNGTLVHSDFDGCGDLAKFWNEPV